MPKISVIVPVYNAEKYLHRCIDSILAQTFTDFELLLIDDGSKDSSPTICDEYAEKDPRIRVFHKENGGVSSARNVGLDNAEGEWVSFVDADDYLPTDALFFLSREINSELIIGGYIDLLDHSKHIPLQEDFKQFLTDELEGMHLRTPWAKLFKKDIISNCNLYFNEEISFGEDLLFVYEYLLHINTISIIQELVYYYQGIGDDYKKKYISKIDSVFKLLKPHSELIEKLKEKEHIFKEYDIGIMYWEMLTEYLKQEENVDYKMVKDFLSSPTCASEFPKWCGKKVKICIALSHYKYSFPLILYLKII